MATMFVSDAASGANDGSDWDNAYTSMGNSNVTGALAGDRIVLDSEHTETGLTGSLWSGINETDAPVSIVSCRRIAGTATVEYEKMADASSPGMLTNSGDRTWAGNVYVRGVRFTHGDGRYGNGGCLQEFMDCEFLFGGSRFWCNSDNGGGGPSLVRFTDCVIGNAGAFPQEFFDIGDWPFSGKISQVECIGCTFNPGQACPVVVAISHGSMALFKQCMFNMSGTTVATDTVFKDNQGSQPEVLRRIKIEDCETDVAAIWFGPNVTGSDERLIINSRLNNTFTSPQNIVELWETYWGSQAQSTSVYRDQPDGAQQGSGFEFSYLFTKINNQTEFTQAFRGQPLNVFVPAGSTSIRVHVASTGNLLRSQIWFDAAVPDNNDPSTSIGQRISSHTTGNVTSTGGTGWTGGPTFTGYVDIPFTATAYDGTAEVTPNFSGNVNDICYVCPALEVT